MKLVTVDEKMIENEQPPQLPPATRFQARYVPYCLYIYNFKLVYCSRI